MLNKTASNKSFNSQNKDKDLLQKEDCESVNTELPIKELNKSKELYNNIDT
jgi:hypothetical protein